MTGQCDHGNRTGRFAAGFRAVPALSEEREEASIAGSHGVDRIPDRRRSVLSGGHDKTRWRFAAAASRHAARFHRSTDRRSAQLHFRENTVSIFMISLSHIGKQYGRQILFVDASFQL